ncbi:MAG: recombinase family protein [Bacilli bacterium]|nr:recombinase family protein [Bacilli bacterium]MBP3920118.1 recombinase family protein [Bacilli bacterium]
MELVREKISPNQYTKLNLEINIDKNEEPNHDNVFWYGGKVASIKSSEGEYVIAARGIVSCDLIAKKDYTNEYGEQIKKGDLIAHIKDKNEGGAFKDEMSLYIKDDNELLDILNEKHELYELNIFNNNWFELSFYNKDGEVEYDDVMDSDSLNDVVDEVLDMIWEQNKDNPLYAIYCRVDNVQGESMIAIQNQINKCLNYINQNVKGNTELIKIYFDRCSGLINHKKTFGKVLEDIKSNNIKELFSVNISRLSRDIKVMIDVREILKANEIDICLVDEGKYLCKDFYNEMSIPIFQKIAQKENLDEPELEEIEYD